MFPFRCTGLENASEKGLMYYSLRCCKESAEFIFDIPKIKQGKNKVCWHKNIAPCVCRLLKLHGANNAMGLSG